MTRVVLVGFMAAGKTTVGRIVAAQLAWDFLDFDLEIEEREGRSIRRIFADEGEAAFRAMEAQVGIEALQRERIVLATGGGWAAAPGRLDDVPPGTLTVWLQVDTETAVTRARAQDATRPLLQGGAIEAAAAMSAARTPAYARARLHLDATGSSPQTLAAAIVDVVRSPRPPSN